MLSEATAYVRSHSWAPPIERIHLGFGIGGVLALFLVRFEQPIQNLDRELWVVVGDLPSAYFVTDDARSPAVAIEVYCALVEDWADRVLMASDLSEAYPVDAPPTITHAKMLKSRLEYIREKLVPEA